MKTSNLEAAQKLRDLRRMYQKMADNLNGYPGYDAVLEVDETRLMISRSQALVILDEYIETNSQKMEDIGLELDE